MTVATPTRIGSLVWRPGVDNSADPYFGTSNPEYISHTLRMASGDTRTVELGMNKKGGGYMWSAKLYGFHGLPNGQELGVPGYGRGMLGSLRSRLHNGMHNPIQSGRHYNIGARTKVIQPHEGMVTVPQFRAPLFDDQEFHFVNHQSEFDFACRTINVSARFRVPAFEHQEYFAWAHAPLSLKEFTDGVIHSGPYQGKKIVDRTALVKDVSQHPGLQRPGDFDYSLVVQTIKGLRPPVSFKFLHFRWDGVWVVKKFGDDADMSSRMAVSPGRSYEMLDGEPVKFARPSMDIPLYILSTHPDPREGVAVGLYVPDDPMNSKQVKIINRSTGLIEFEEDRRILFNFTVSKSVNESWKGNAFNVMLARCTLSGLLNPESATQAYGFPAVEVVTNKTVVFYGTPAEILEGVI